MHRDSKLLLELPFYRLCSLFPEFNASAGECPEVVAFKAVEKDLVLKPCQSSSPEVEAAAMFVEGDHAA